MTVHWYRPSQCILTLVIISSVLVFLGCLACGYVLHFAPEEPSRYINGGNYTFIPALCLAAASALSIVALILGCCGIFKDSKVVLIVFAVCAVLVGGIQLGSTSTVFTFMMNGKVRNQVSGVMLKDLLDYSDYNNGSANIFNNIQNDYNCCGISNYSDWRTENTTWRREEDDEKAYAPSSCCTTEYQNNANCTESTAALKQQGCLDVLANRMKVVVYPVFGFSVALALLEVAAALVACYGAVLIRRYQNYDVL